MATNTVTNLSKVNIAESGITLLNSTLAPLSVFTTAFSANPIAPMTTVIVPMCTTTGNTVINPTDFEFGTSSLQGVSITLNQYVQNWQVSDSDAQNGVTFSQLDEANIRNFAAKLNDTVLAVVTSSNFTASAASGTVSSSAFTVTQMKTMRQEIAAYPVKNIVMDGNAYSSMLGVNLQSYDLSKGGVYGFNTLAENTRLDQCATPCSAFVTAPSAIVMASGLSIVPSDKAFTKVEVWTIPGINLPVLFEEWFSTKTHTNWRALRVCFGAARGDQSALKYFVSL